MRLANGLAAVGLSISLAAIALAAVGCDDPKKGSTPGAAGTAPTGASAASAPTSAAAATPEHAAKQIYAVRCTPCHGASGKGDGIIAASLNPKPRDYTSAAWQATISDDQLRKTILSGGEAVGKSQMMPANPDLADKVDVTTALVQLIRSFASPAK